jgi:quinol monooxygenase YgiN
MKSMVQARHAPGNISADARTINGVHHTLSVWTDQDAMRAYLTAGPHLAAMRLFPRIATGKVVGYLARQAPDWSEVHTIWLERGRVV